MLAHAAVRTLVALALCVPIPAAVATAAGKLRVATYNVERLDAPGSAAYAALVDVLRRVDADVVLLQEIATATEAARVADLAAAIGYPHHCTAEVSGTLSGGLRTAALSRAPMLACASWSAVELSGDRAANDLGRDVLELHVAPEPGRAPWGLFTVHLKAGGGEANRFRRQVEMLRVVQAVERFVAAHPGSPVVLTGDFNEDLRFGPFGTPRFAAPPAGLPRTYRLGSDVVLPIAYDPFETIAAAGLAGIAAMHPGAASVDVTHPPTFRRIDYLWGDVHVGVERAQVYDACAEPETRARPARRRRRASGRRPLACGPAAAASDHLAVFADLVRRPVDRDGDGIDDADDAAPLDPGLGARPAQGAP